MTTTETYKQLRAAHEAQIDDPRFFPWALSERYVRQAAYRAGCAGLDADDPRVAWIADLPSWRKVSPERARRAFTEGRAVFETLKR